MKIDYQGFTPEIGTNCWIAPNAWVIGRCTLGSDCSVWFSSIVRGDVNFIEIGDRTNVQDGSVLHVTGPLPDQEQGYPLIIGRKVTVGHKAVLHGCTIGDACLIGMSATILDGAIIGEKSIVGAGALVTPGKNFPARSLILGSPAVVARSLSPQEIASLYESAEHYVKYKDQYLKSKV